MDIHILENTKFSMNSLQNKKKHKKTNILWILDAIPPQQKNVTQSFSAIKDYYRKYLSMIMTFHYGVT